MVVHRAVSLVGWALNYTFICITYSYSYSSPTGIGLQKHACWCNIVYLYEIKEESMCVRLSVIECADVSTQAGTVAAVR